jgi:hypothetical protein
VSGKCWVGVVVVSCGLLLLHSANAVDHEFRYKAPDASSVQLMGEVNFWKGQSMTKGSDGIWRVTVSLSPGTYAYKFLVNGKDWVFDPDNPSRKTADGVENSAVEIGPSGTVSLTPILPPKGLESLRRSVLGAEFEFSPPPGEVTTVETPLSPQRRMEAAKDKEPNLKLAHARIGVVVPQGFDPLKTWPVLVVTNTEAYSNIDALRQFKDSALAENWVILAADEVNAEPNKEGAMKWPCMAAAFDYLTRAWPGLKDWPVACAGMSGGAKNSSFLAGDLAREHHRVIGLLLMGCNQDTASVAFRKGGATGLLNASVFISSGKTDTIATPERAVEVKNSLQATGFRRVRLESYDGAHDIYQPHVGEALRWFLAQSPNSSGASPSPPSDFDKFFKKP